MTKLKQIGPYLLLVMVSWFPAFFISDNFLDPAFLTIRDSSDLIGIAVVAVIIYGVYSVIHLILKKILPLYIYKDNVPVKLIVFFLTYVIGLVAFPIIVLIIMGSIFGGI
jgi:hypothetical protein